MTPNDAEFKYEQIAAGIVELIKSGTFGPGDRLPSLRQLSRQEGVSVSTAMQAYYLLEAQGWIEPRERSGFYVRVALPGALPEPEITSPVADPTAVSMRQLVTRVVLVDAQDPGLVQLGAAHPNLELSAAGGDQPDHGRSGPPSWDPRAAGTTTYPAANRCACRSLAGRWPPGCAWFRMTC